MQSLYQAYQSYERKVLRGELDKIPAVPHSELKNNRLPFSYRLGDSLVRIGLKLKRQAQAGHALTSTTMALK
jgi:hypothetical protein